MNFQNQIDYLQEILHDDMFVGVSVPDPLDPEALKSQIVFRCGLLTPTYSEPQIMQAAITQFFKTEQWNIKHLINIILAEYSPIENTDRYSEQVTKNNGSGSVTHSGSNTRTIEESGTDRKENQESGTTTDTREISAYNSSNYQPDNKETVGHGKRTEEDLIHGKTVDDTTTYGHKITDSKDGTTNYTEHTHGNVGTMTNFQLINGELELIEAFDVYDWIAAKLEKELFLQVY